MSTGLLGSNLCQAQTRRPVAAAKVLTQRRRSRTAQAHFAGDLLAAIRNVESQLRFAATQ